MKKLSVNVLNTTGEVVSALDLNKDVFQVKENTQVMFDAVQVYQANMRQATAKTKTRHEVSGGGKKPWRQKGTGRARAGSSRSPIWVGGGNALGPDGNQNYKLAQNKKAHKLALRSALSLKVKENLIVVDELKVSGKTKDMKTILNAIKASGRVLLVSSDELVHQASKNLENVVVREFNNVSVYDLLNTKSLVVDQNDIKKIEEVLA
ncbi:MAG: 50S ribosomal protein L4 [Firmicutes bacterium]|nr:50S ribosomal protein L4 [Candidatus Alectryobacillus merdavium]